MDVPSRGDDKINYTAKGPRHQDWALGTGREPPPQNKASMISIPTSTRHHGVRGGDGTSIDHVLRPDGHSFPAPTMTSSGKDAPPMVPYRGVLGECWAALFRLIEGSGPEENEERGNGRPSHPVRPAQSVVGSPDWARFPVHVSGPLSVMDGNQPPSSDHSRVPQGIDILGCRLVEQSMLQLTQFRC